MIMAYSDDVLRVASLKIPWTDLRWKNILVTGATGMIGTTLVDVLMAHSDGGYHVYAAGRNEYKMMSHFSKYLTNPFFHFLKYDVREPLNSNIDFQIIIAGAGVASPQLYSTDPVGVMRSNFNGVDNLFIYGIAHGLERLLYISSGEVYGEGDGRIFTEDYSGYVDCTTLRACYPTAKRATESLCIAYGCQYSIDVRIARPCHVYGPYFTDSDQRVYAQFIRNVLEGDDIVMKSDGTQFRSWCYVVDCVSALLYILLKGRNGEAYNIADESSNITIKELAETIADIAGKKVRVTLSSDFEKKGYNIVKKSLMSSDKLKSIGWTIDSSFREKMNNTIIECKYENKNVSQI